MKKKKHPIFEPQYVNADCSQLEIEGILAERSLRTFIEENGGIGFREFARRQLDKTTNGSEDIENTTDRPMDIEE